jgi:hypothetical protein
MSNIRKTLDIPFTVEGLSVVTVNLPEAGIAARSSGASKVTDLAFPTLAEIDQSLFEQHFHGYNVLITSVDFKKDADLSFLAKDSDLKFLVIANQENSEDYDIDPFFDLGFSPLQTEAGRPIVIKRRPDIKRRKSIRADSAAFEDAVITQFSGLRIEEPIDSD